jgi:hypothetical protein
MIPNTLFDLSVCDAEHVMKPKRKKLKIQLFIKDPDV